MGDAAFIRQENDPEMEGNVPMTKERAEEMAAAVLARLQAGE